MNLFRSEFTDFYDFFYFGNDKITGESHCAVGSSGIQMEIEIAGCICFGCLDQGNICMKWHLKEIFLTIDRPFLLAVLNFCADTGRCQAAAKAGAHVTHVDASKGMVAWAKENARSSGLSEAPIRWIVDDCVKFVEREIRRGNHYDGIIMDPPSYGRGPKGEIWKIEESIHPFVQLCAKLLSDQPLFYLINSYTTGLAPAVLTYMLSTELVPKVGGSVRSEDIGLPVTDSGLVLPCGASGRWEA